jgi:D-alanine-D-alanine ligase
MRVGILYNIDKSNSFDEYNQEISEISNYLKNNNHEVIMCELDNSGLDAVKKQLIELKEKVDIVFNLAEFLDNEDSSVEWKIAKMMSDLDITYTGTNWEFLKLTINKPLMKEIITKAKIPTPQYQIFKSVDEKLTIPYPVIVKAAYENASFGIFKDSVAENEEQLKKCVKRILDNFKQPALVEEFIDGNEFQVGIVNNEPTIVMMSQINFDLPDTMKRILTYDGKWNDTTIDYINTTSSITIKISETLKEKLVSIAKKTHNLFNSQDYSRIDFRTRGEDVYVLEINFNHCINPNSDFRNRLSTANLDYQQFIDKVISLAVKRKEEASFLKTERLTYVENNITHIPYLVKWFNDKKIGEFMESPDHEYDEEELYESFKEKSKDKSFIFYYENKPVGYINIYEIDYVNKKAEFSFLIGEKEFQGKGLSKESLIFIKRYVFEYLKLNSLFATIISLNIPSIRSLESGGFTRIGIKRENCLIKGQFVDEVFLDMTAKDYFEEQK